MLNVDVENVPEFINRISKFDKDIYKTLQAEIRQGLTAVADDARQRTPNGRALTGWGPWNESTGKSASVGVVTLNTGTRELGFRGSDVKRGITPQSVKRSKRGQVTRFGGRVISKSPAGAIFALAGSRDDSDSFTQALNRKHGTTWPRTLTDALYSKGPDARKAIEAAIEKAAASISGRNV